MNEAIGEVPAKRKVLSLRLEPAKTPEEEAAPKFVENREAVYMVWCDGGDMPKRVYRADERDKAVSHAKLLASAEGKRFHVLRSFRAFEPEA
jgi:hypothetical protein